MTVENDHKSDEDDDRGHGAGGPREHAEDDAGDNAHDDGRDGAQDDAGDNAQDDAQDDAEVDAQDGVQDDAEVGAQDHVEDNAQDAENEDGTGTELTLVGMHGNPPRPPRRTGVFLDPEDLREYVGGLLRAILGGYEVDAFGNFTFTHQGARAFVTVGPSPIGPQVGVFSVTNLDLDLTPELGTFLLTTNHKLGFGAFSYDPPNRAVWLRHTLLGSTLDLPELQSAVAAIATTAAGLDERIRDQFGGRTFQEAPDDVQRRMEPPDAAGDGRPPNASGYL